MPRFIWMIISIFTAWAIVQTVHLNPIRGQQVPELIRAIDDQQQRIQTVTASFSQIRISSLSREPLISSGLVKFKRPDQVHWIYVKPEPMEITMDSKYIWFYAPGRSQAERYSLARGKRGAQYLEPLTAVFQKTFVHLAEGYNVAFEGLEADRNYHFRLHPREEKVQKFLTRVDLWIDKTSGAILRFKIVESSGDQLSIEFQNLQINPPLTEEDLKIKIPPSIRVGEPSRP